MGLAVDIVRRFLPAAFAGHDAIVNLASALPPTNKFMSTRAWRENDRVRTDGSSAVVDAAIGAGVGRVVQESVSMLYPDRGAQWIDEDVLPDQYPMARANLAAEANANRFCRAGGTGIVLRFGWFYGPGATHSEEFFKLARRHICIALGRPDTFVSSIQMADAGAAVAAALLAPTGTLPSTLEISLSGMGVPAGRRYEPGTNVLETTWQTATGWAPRYPSAREGWAATAIALKQRGLSKPGKAHE